MPRIIAIAFIVLAHAAFAGAQAPQSSTATATTRLIPFAGTTPDISGAPFTGEVTVTFELYEDQEGGAPLWSESQTVSVNRGRYQVYLGGGAPLPQAAFSQERARWLGVSVGNRALPRVMLVAVPYALRAADADTLGGQPAASFVRSRADGRLETSAGVSIHEAVDGSGIAGQLAKFSSATTLSSSVISESASNRIGINLPDPTGGGVVDSVFSIKNLDNNTGFGILNETQQRRFAINTLASGGWLLYDGGSSTWNAGIGQLNGRLGIGTTTPDDQLHLKSAASPSLRIDGPVNTAAVGAKLRMTEDSGVAGGVGFEAFLDGITNTLVWRTIDFNSVQNDNILVMKRGTPNNIGIGLLDPLDKLHVAGDVRVGTGTTGCVKDADATIIAGTCSSDRRLKKNVTPFHSSLDKVSQLQPVHFYWNADAYPDRHFGASESFGLIAQDVEQVLPELVTTDDQGYKAVRYSALPLHMLQAIKELKAENDSLKQLLQAQEARLRRLEEARK